MPTTCPSAHSNVSMTKPNNTLLGCAVFVNYRTCTEHMLAIIQVYQPTPPPFASDFPPHDSSMPFLPPSACPQAPANHPRSHCFRQVLPLNDSIPVPSYALSPWARNPLVSNAFSSLISMSLCFPVFSYNPLSLDLFRIFFLYERSICTLSFGCQARNR